MSMDSWTQKFDAALTRASYELSGLTDALSEFLGGLSLVEKILLGALGVLTLCYMFMPGGRGDGAGNPSGRYFAGILLLFVATGVFAGLVMSGDISL